MSGPDQGDHSRNFLARWSQRKQEAKQPEHEAPVSEAKLPAEQVAEGEPGMEFDLSSLPKLEEMTATTDITAFLHKGVPEHLRNAALRKSWALDPAIRNYVNPALDYAYDWNTPGGVPGSSEIGPGMDVARLVSQIMGGPEEEARDSADSGEQHAAQQPPPDQSVQAPREEAIAGVQKPVVEAKPPGEEPAEGRVAPQQPVRRHGSAKPLD